MLPCVKVNRLRYVVASGALACPVRHAAGFRITLALRAPRLMSAAFAFERAAIAVLGVIGFAVVIADRPADIIFCFFTHVSLPH
jgi:hypothetical protein